MSLTIPKAGISPGAVASPRIEAPETGGVVADFGRRMQAVGAQLQQEREQRNLNRARVDMMSGLNDLSLEFDQIGDPDRIDAEYGARAGELKDKVVGNLPAGIQDQAALAFDEMSIAHAARQGQRAVGLRKSAEMAGVMAGGSELVRAAAIADPQTQAAYRDQFDDQLDNLVARGVLSPDEAERQRQDFGGQVETARASRLLSEDPDSLVAAIDAGEFAVMDGQSQQGWRARATAAARTNAARAEAEDKRARTERLGEAAQMFKDGIDVLHKGQPYAQADIAAALLSDPDIAALPEAREYAATVVLTEQRPEIAMLPLPQKRALLAELEKTPVEKGYETDTAVALRSMIAADETRFAEDPLGRAEEIGLTPPPVLPDPSTATPEDLVQGLRARGRYSQSLVASDYVEADGARIFTPDERDRWAKAVAPEASPEDRARVAKSLAVGLGPLTTEAAQEIGADPVFTYVGTGLASGLPERLGRQIFEGQRVIAGKQVKLPAVPDRRQAFFGTFSGLFNDGTAMGWQDQSGVRDQITAAADALYAFRMRGQVASGEDIDGQIEETTYLQAVHEVMGGTGSYDSRSARGGLQDVRGEITILPNGVSGRDVEARLDELSSRMNTPRIGEIAWANVSATGNRPQLGGQRPDAHSVRRMALRAVGPDQYLMVWPNSQTGELTVVMGDDGHPFAISLSALLNGGEAP